MEDVVRQHNARYAAPEGFDVARTVGNVASPVSWAGGGTGLARVAAMGAAQAGLAPTEAGLDTGDFLAEKGKQMALGGAVPACCRRCCRVRCACRRSSRAKLARRCSSRA